MTTAPEIRIPLFRSHVTVKRNLSLFALLGLLLSMTVAIAQTSPPADVPATTSTPGAHPVAVVDLVRIFNECAQIQDLNQLMKEQTDEFAKEAAQRRKVIEDKQTELGAFRPGSDDFAIRRKDLVRLNIDANVWLKVSEQAMDQDKFDWTRIIYENVLKTVDEIARERGYDIVLNRTEFRPDDIEQTVQTLRRLIQDRTVVHNVPEIEITDLVIRKLDAAYKAAGGKKQLSLSQTAGVKNP